MGEIFAFALQKGFCLSLFYYKPAQTWVL